MAPLLMLVGGICYLASVVAWIIILIDAFRNEVWKGIVSLICGLYGLYYAFTEFQNDNKALVIAVAIGGGILGGAMMGVARSMAGIR